MLKNFDKAFRYASLLSSSCATVCDKSLSVEKPVTKFGALNIWR